MTSHIKKYDYIFKILVIGNDAVGKSCTLLRYVEDSFTPYHFSTIVK